MFNGIQIPFVAGFIVLYAFKLSERVEAAQPINTTVRILNFFNQFISLNNLILKLFINVQLLHVELVKRQFF